MAWTHTISWQLEILPNNKILVPGAEPSSALSSRTLAAYLAKAGFGNALVDLQAALDAIPGSFIKYGANYGRGGLRQRWFVLPPYRPQCPCLPYVDYFKILKALANVELPVQESFETCDINGMGYCPHPDFKFAEPPPNSPYKDERTFPSGGGVLPPIPSWLGPIAEPNP